MKKETIKELREFYFEKFAEFGKENDGASFDEHREYAIGEILSLIMRKND